MLTPEGTHDPISGDLLLHVAGECFDLGLNLQAGNFDGVLRAQEEKEVERESHQRDQHYTDVDSHQEVGDQKERDQVHPDVGQRAANKVLGDFNIADEARDNRTGFVAVEERSRQTQNAIIEFVAQVEYRDVAGFPGIIMTNISQRRPEKDKNQDETANGGEQIGNFLLWSEGGTEEHVVEQVTGHLGNEQRHTELDDSADGSGDNLPFIGTDITEKANEIVWSGRGFL